MAIYMTARFTVRSESVEKCQQAIADLVDHVTRYEPETRMYYSLQDAEDETRFLNFFIFENEDAEARHAESEALKLFSRLSATLTDCAVYGYSPVASNVAQLHWVNPKNEMYPNVFS